MGSEDLPKLSMHREKAVLISIINSSLANAIEKELKKIDTCNEFEIINCSKTIWKNGYFEPNMILHERLLKGYFCDVGACDGKDAKDYLEYIGNNNGKH